MLVRVLEIPAPTGEYRFAGPEPQIFKEVDWFRDPFSDPTPDNQGPGWMDTHEGRARIVEFVKISGYYSDAKAYLILHPTHSFTINYSAP